MIIVKEGRREVRIPVNFVDIKAGIRQDMNTALISTKVGFKGVAERSRNLLEDLENAVIEMNGRFFKVELVLTEED